MSRDPSCVLQIWAVGVVASVPILARGRQTLLKIVFWQRRRSWCMPLSFHEWQQSTFVILEQNPGYQIATRYTESC